MKYLKKFETGEANRNIDLDYVKKHRDDGSEEYSWVKWLYEQLILIINHLENIKIVKIIDIKVFDKYQGPYATVEIFNKIYKIWLLNDDSFWIDDFPIDNTSSDIANSGFRGDILEISNLLNEINAAGDVDLYINSKKYNL
jgi:hypothetical protein